MSEWTKVRHSLFDDPKTLAVARYLDENKDFAAWLIGESGNHCLERATDAVTFRALILVSGALALRVWATANKLSENGFLKSATLETLDHFADGAPGFGRAMASVKWAIEQGDPPGVILPNFNEWNSPKKNRQRKTNAERCLEYRQKKSKNSPANTPTRKRRANDAQQRASEALTSASRDARCCASERSKEDREIEREEIPPRIPPKEEKDKEREEKTPHGPPKGAEAEISPTGRRFPEKQQISILTPEAISQEWCFICTRRSRVGMPADRPEQLAPDIAELLRLGLEATKIVEAIKDPKRDRGEHWWQFRDRLRPCFGSPPLAQKPSKAEMIDRLLAEEKAKQTPKGG